VSLLIDPPTWPGWEGLWSHLVSDVGTDELHEFASRTGLPRRAFHLDHYDVPARAYEELVAAGARPVSSRTLVETLVRTGQRRRKADTLRARRLGSRLLRPARLRAGDPVTVVAPAGPVPAARLDRGLGVLRSWGLETHVGGHVFDTHPRLAHLAGTDAERADDLVEAWCRPGVRAVFAARGGSGSHRLLDLLDWDRMAAAGPRVLVGFSDVSGLHEAVANRLGVVSVHGPVVASLGEAPDGAVSALHALLFDADRAVLAGTPMLPGTPRDPAEGVLLGGNLAVLAASLGTASSRPAAGGIAVLEDVAEPAYKVDRLLTSLLRSGWFDDVRGVGLGAFSGCDDHAQVTAVLTERLAPLDVPVLAGLPIGHVPDNRALPFGVRARMDVRGGTLEVLDRPLR
jgi:muramoyltetrapeptide carboxypeptidase